ncbi:MAG: CIA30 family protein [Candidatus Coatesbacteria bacterium]
MSHANRALLAAALLMASQSPAAALKLPAVFGDGAVLQQGLPLPVWGWAQPGARVTVRLLDQERKAVAGASGRWKVVFAPIPSGVVGELVVKSGRETATSRGLLAGEVWLCSGQSNMGVTVNASEGGAEAAKAAEDPNLHLLRMPDVVSAQPLSDVPVAWRAATPESAGSFSAVAYYFARQLRQELQVPVGVIQAAWGGTCAEVWTDQKSLAGEPSCAPILARWKERVRQDPDLARSTLPFKLEIDRIDLIPADGSERVPLDRFSGPGLPGKWESPWASGISAAKFEVTTKGGRRGLFTGTVGMSSAVSEMRTLGETDRGADLSRFAAIRLRVRGQGRFHLSFRQPEVWDWAFHETPEFRAKADWQEVTFTFTETKQPDWGTQKPIALGAVTGLIVTATHVPFAYPEVPSGLFNGELAPLIPYAIRGALWYQGEGNAGRAWQYRSLLPAMIRGWRAAWGQGDFPFYIVQLPGWQAPNDAPVDNDWAELREAQAFAAGDLAGADYVCAIDLGDAADIHPKRKREVGERLALTAFVRAYERNAEYSGPRYSGMLIEGARIRIRFSHVGTGLMSRDGTDIAGFGIAGDDRKFVKAAARIDGDTVVVESPEVPHPAAVRYAWGPNPVCNLGGRIGLPASPFRTDDWPVTTVNNR